MISDWIETTLEEVCSQITDGSHFSPKSVEQGLPMASVKDMTPFGINLETCRHISEEDFATLVRQGCQPKVGDILVAKDGATALETVCEIKRPLNAVLLSSIAILRPDTRKIASSYLRYYMDSESTRQYMKNSFVTGAAIPRVVLRDFKRCRVLFPPLPIQRKIAAMLSAYDDLIENNKRRIAILEEMAQALYREWFVHFRFPGHEKNTLVESLLGPIPVGWEIRRLGDFGDIITGKTPSTKRSENFGNYMPFIKLPDMHGNIFCIQTEEALSAIGAASQRGKTIPPNSLCVSCIGTAGIVTITAKQSQTNQQINSIVLNKQSNREFLYFALLGLKEIIQQYGANGATMVNLNKRKFEALQVMYSQELIEAFHSLTHDHFEQIRTLQYQNANLRQTRDLLLPKLIAGEIDVERLEIETGA